VVGDDQTVVTVYEDTLYDLAAKYSLGSEELIRVNPGIDLDSGCRQDAHRTRDGTSCPRARAKALSSICPSIDSTITRSPPSAAARSKSSPTPSVSARWTGNTPLGVTHVIQKQKDPTWFPTDSVRKEHEAAVIRCLTRTARARQSAGAIRHAPRGRQRTYLIHGTNNPIAVGLAVTHGCIRMYPDDVPLCSR